MSFLSIIKRKLKFYLEQDLAVIKPSDLYSIPKGLFKKYLPSNPVIVDCGSHVGSDSIDLGKIFPKAEIHSFEPVPEIFQQLKINTSKYKNIHCYPLALGDIDGKTEMFVSSLGSDASSSLLKPASHLIDHPNVLFESRIQVDILKLDTWAQENNVKKVDLLWLDMQGFEYQMLKASNKILPSVKVIHTEISTRETYEGVLTYNSFRKWLEEQNFNVAIEAIPEGTDMGNALFVRE